MFIFLSVTVKLISAAYGVPDCESCPYVDNIGFVKSDDYCAEYFVVSQHYIHICITSVADPFLYVVTQTSGSELNIQAPSMPSLLFCT